MDIEQKAYRDELIKLDQKVQEEYDKVILALSGGALGLSITFIHDIVELNAATYKSLLFVAWVFWTMSMASVMLSHVMSHQALRRTIKQVDDGSLYEKKPGGVFDWGTSILNSVSGLAFLAGTILMIIFVYTNI